MNTDPLTSATNFENMPAQKVFERVSSLGSLNGELYTPQMDNLNSITSPKSPFLFNSEMQFNSDYGGMYPNPQQLQNNPLSNSYLSGMNQPKPYNNQGMDFRIQRNSSNRV